MWDTPPYGALSAGLKLRNVANGTFHIATERSGAGPEPPDRVVVTT
jgi:hypothetical protein